MSYRFDHSEIYGKRIFDELLAVSGDSGAYYRDPVTAEGVYFYKLFADDLDRISAV